MKNRETEKQKIGTRILGITGGVGAGKTTVLSYLEGRYQARVLELDQVARDLQQPGAVCYEPMIALFGSQVLDETGNFDRKKIAELVFGSKELLKKLNDIVHPQVRLEVSRRISHWRQEGSSLIVLEAALLLEEQYQRVCDEVWYVYASEEARRRRLALNRGYTQEKITGIVASQKPDAFFREHCQFIVDNSSDSVENTYEQIDKGMKKHGFL